MSETGLQRLFARFGPLESARVVTGPNGFCRGFGYVTFASNAAALLAQSMLDGAQHNGDTLRVAAAV
jgi:RNA recognition motif-containing protein